MFSLVQVGLENGRMGSRKQDRWWGGKGGTLLWLSWQRLPASGTVPLILPTPPLLLLRGRLVPTLHQGALKPAGAAGLPWQELHRSLGQVSAFKLRIYF